VEIEGRYTGFNTLGILSAGATFSGYPYLMGNSVSAPMRFYNAYIRFKQAVINDTIVLDIEHTERFDHRLVRPHWLTMHGYISSLIWNAWNESENRLPEVERVVGWCGVHPETAVMFRVPGGELITSIEVTFYIFGVEYE
jgi:hypothetical protein